MSFEETCGQVTVEGDFDNAGRDWIARLFALGEFLYKTDPKPEIHVAIYAFECETIGGLRISEIDFVLDQAGLSYMQGDFDTLPTIACCEAFLATYGIVPHKPPGWDSYLNEHGESRINLLNSMDMTETAEAEYEQQQADEAKLEEAAKTG